MSVGHPACTPWGLAAQNSPQRALQRGSSGFQADQLIKSSHEKSTEWPCSFPSSHGTTLAHGSQVPLEQVHVSPCPGRAARAGSRPRPLDLGRLLLASGGPFLPLISRTKPSSPSLVCSPTPRNTQGIVSDGHIWPLELTKKGPRVNGKTASPGGKEERDCTWLGRTADHVQ